MKEVFFIVSIVLGGVVVVISKMIIIKKKDLVYKYVDKTRKITLFDYLQDFDGNWLMVSIDYNKMLEENNADREYILSEMKSIKKLNIILLVSFIGVLVWAISFKIMGYLD